MRILFAVLLTLASAALLVFIPASKSKEELNISEAVFRYEINQLQKSSGICYLSINGKAPPDGFMRHLAWVRHPVKKVSECRSSAGGVVDKKTGTRGFTLTTGRVRWISHREVEVSCDFFANGLSASGWTCRLKKSGSGWEIIQRTGQWFA